MNATVFYVNSENRLRFPAISKTASSGESGLCDAERVGCLLRVWIEEEWFGEAVPIPADRPDYRRQFSTPCFPQIVTLKKGPGLCAQY